MKVLWLFFLVVAAIPCQSALAAAAGGGKEAALELRSVQADFVQVKHLKILARPLVSTGTFAFQVPQSLRWEYLEPVRSVLIMHNGAVRKFVERDGRLEEERGAQVGSLQIVLAEISNWLAGRFTDNEMFTVSFIDDRTIRFTPKEQQIAALISGIEIEIGGENGLLDSVLIEEGPDSYTRMTFSNRSINQQLPATLFTGP
ncbi:outer membrane lipoprotein carrier protein LolA [Desulfofustis glycolicus]|uniref:Outer membrane lipoprotein-sorting protein n=1 Tax=Desulfofustis glycolicus DSM 9705 TaxID=1121409 RepID=A0A1M5UNC3_9BACT|nr:outer membrane lipoprotein carrier protein LolA [Desulfofustis glycolicus]MCB2217396.1 outer membrane lipoprotein carrier protein LolA [Desulfobulbaceae bacterium]SHH64406.1 Outer membrane lipoprotein-sorting protein [Desulfofustis glycolicus DSM 9705]